MSRTNPFIGAGDAVLSPELNTGIWRGASFEIQFNQNTAGALVLTPMFQSGRVLAKCLTIWAAESNELGIGIGPNTMVPDATNPPARGSFFCLAPGRFAQLSVDRGLIDCSIFFCCSRPSLNFTVRLSVTAWNMGG